MDNLARAAQALSDETRLRILNVLMVQECCVCEVMQALEISQTRASRNLKILNDAGFLSMRTNGLYSLYSLKNSANGFHANLLEAIKKEVAGNPTARRVWLRKPNGWALDVAPRKRRELAPVLHRQSLSELLGFLQVVGVRPALGHSAEQLHGPVGVQSLAGEVSHHLEPFR